MNRKNDMPALRTGRRKYYDIFSRYYDAFIRMHARQGEDDTRNFLVNAAHMENKTRPRVLDICCGTGSVILSFSERFPDCVAVGYDFSHGMLLKAKEKNTGTPIIFIEGDAALLPFTGNSFDVVTCSHAIYELKGEAREKSLEEMKRVVRADGLVLLMEHEVPKHPLVKVLFYIRMIAMGSHDAREFVKGGMKPFEKIFPTATLSHSQSGKSKLVTCQK